MPIRPSGSGWRTYDPARARAYDVERAAPDEHLAEVRDLLVAELADVPAGAVIDVGAGTGLWSERLVRWVQRPVVAVEPSPAMLARLAGKRLEGVLAVRGRAEALPVRCGSCAAVWLSTVVHHLDDLDRAAVEAVRVLSPRGVVLVRNSFPDQESGTAYPTRFFPSAAKVAAEFPTLATVVRAFGGAGLELRRRHSPGEVASASRKGFLARVEARADSLLREVDDHEFAAGLKRLRRWVAAAPGRPVLFHPDLLVFCFAERSDGYPAGRQSQ